MELRTRVVLQLAMATGAAASTLQMRWTTDAGACSSNGGQCNSLGPDGPWQAVMVTAGLENADSNSAAEVVDMPMWPAVGSISGVLTTSSGGEYNPFMSVSANKTGVRHDAFGPWLANLFINMTDEGPGYQEILRFKTSTDNSDELNATIVAAETWDIRMPTGAKYEAPAGFLGLGPSTAEDNKSIPPGLLDQLKAAGTITSNSFGLHMGSVALGQKGSLILGGYEQNRALGDVGVFELVNEVTRAFIVDLTLSVETGSSPFNQTGSMWKGVEGSEYGPDVTKNIGGVSGSAAILPSAVTPYIYLPPGNCEAVAEQLPVTFRQDLGLYTWNTEDPAYARIVNSPAYMGFVLADRTAQNITIKIPFKLLNLTLESPLVAEPTPYFPCKSVDSAYGVWQLGRAFLQGAFLGFNFEKSVMYMAQAPGPDMDQGVTRTLEVDDEVILSNAADTFEKTWRSQWTVLGGDETGSGEGGAETPNGSAPPAVGNDGQNAPGNKIGEAESANGDGETEENLGQVQEQGSLSVGAIAGVVVGVVAVLGLVASGLLFWRRRRRQAAKEDVPEKEWEAESASGVHFPGLGIKYEMYAPRVTHEAPGVELRHEMDGTGIGRRSMRISQDMYANRI
ncbi:aspartic peptidase domain-containing protein [Plectosphaerella plurivora]|uniref:Aspartic peptidase domain-containing protein n=1 Tax=Plectosphaerella plurivora TaxID=936078 RepID=A0A9P9ABZ1_9PEZI|nr:aspartic peptidase domain-containing protein [Plectosphaerella plurivora]